MKTFYRDLSNGIRYEQTAKDDAIALKYLVQRERNFIKDPCVVANRSFALENLKTIFGEENKAKEFALILPLSNLLVEKCVPLIHSPLSETFIC